MAALPPQHEKQAADSRSSADPQKHRAAASRTDSNNVDPAAPLRRHFLTSAAAAFSCSALSLATALAAHADDLDGTINRLEAAAGSGEAHISFVGWLTLACMGYWLVKAISYLFIDSQDEDGRANKDGGVDKDAKESQPEDAKRPGDPRRDPFALSKARVRSFSEAGAKSGEDPQEFRNKSLARSATYTVATAVREGAPRVHALLLAEAELKRKLAAEVMAAQKAHAKEAATPAQASASPAAAPSSSSSSPAPAAPQVPVSAQQQQQHEAQHALGPTCPVGIMHRDDFFCKGLFMGGGEGGPMPRSAHRQHAPEVEAAMAKGDPVAYLVADCVEAASFKQAQDLCYQGSTDPRDILCLGPHALAKLEAQLLQEIAAEAVQRELANLESMAVAGKLRVDGKPCASSHHSRQDGGDGGGSAGASGAGKLGKDGIWRSWK